MPVLVGQALERAFRFVYADELVREFHRAVGGEQVAAAQGEGRVEIVPGVIGGDPHRNGRDVVVRLRRQGACQRVDLEDALQAVDEGVEIQVVSVFGPDGSRGVVVESGGDVTCSENGRQGGLPFALRLVLQVGHHQARLVGLIAVARHAQESDVLPVRAPDRVGVVASAHRDDGRFAGNDLVNIDFRIRREGVFLSGLHLLAGVGDHLPVRAPGELFHPAERLRREFILPGIRAQDIERVRFGDASLRSAQGRDIGLRAFGRPVVPVPVHQVFGDVGFGLVEGGVEILRGLDRAGHRAAEEHLALVGTEREFPDARRDVREADATLQCIRVGSILSAFHGAGAAQVEGRFPQLAALDVEETAPVKRPAGAREALPVGGELDPVALPEGCSVLQAGEEKVPAGAVFFNGGVADTVQDELAVRGQLRVGETPQGEKGFRSHFSVRDLGAGGPDVAGIGFLLGSTVRHHEDSGRNEGLINGLHKLGCLIGRKDHPDTKIVKKDFFSKFV